MSFNNNSAKNGAGLAVISGATATLNNSTISSNTATNMGGGILTISSATFVTLNNTTVSENTASSSWGGGGIMVANIATATLNGSIVSGNSAGGLHDEVYNDGGTVNANNCNVFGYNGINDDQAYYSFAPGAADVNATTGDGSAAGTALSAILDTATGFTATDSLTAYYALPAGSPAIDLCSGSCPNNAYADQRGFNRPINFKCDAGSYEYSAMYTAACGNGHDIHANIWQMIAPPSCVPAAPTDINSQYNGDFTGAATYGTTWISYKWKTTPPPQNYVALAGSDPLTLGVGLWTLSTLPGTLGVNGSATATEPCSNYGSGLSGNCYAIDLTPYSDPAPATSFWQMVGHPFPYTVDWSDVRVATFDGAVWTQRTPSKAQTDNIMSQLWWRYNNTGSAYETYDGGTPGMSGTLRPSETFWVKMLPGSSGLSGLKLLIPAR